MTVNATHNQWTEVNQHYISARLNEILRAIESDKILDPSLDFSHSDGLASEMEHPPALVLLTEVLGLSPFEQFVLLLCAGYEMDDRFARALQKGLPANAVRPCFEIALNLFQEGHWSALTPIAPLRQWRLIELESGPSIVRSPLRIDERILHYLTGISYLDSRLRGIIKPENQDQRLTPSLAAKASEIVLVWNHNQLGNALPIIQLCGPRPSDMRSIANRACAELNFIPYYLEVTDIPADSSELEALAVLWQRESIIDRAALVISASNEKHARLGKFIDGFFTPCIIIDKQPVDLTNKASLRIDIPHPDSREQIALWTNALGETASYVNGGLQRVVSQFSLTAQEIDNVGQQVSNHKNKDEGDLNSALWQYCRLQSRKRLDSLAQRIENSHDWDDLVLPATQKEMLQDIVAQTRHRFRVYEEWGFTGKSSIGQGISVIFHGPSGTGKTMAAGVMANALQLDLYRIDLSQVVNKYIGETEKNLARLFDAAEDSGAILLFDEADSLFAKRTEVKNSYDRNANMETSYLLQRMENYRGLAILTTNLKKEMDTAFMRRIRFALQFPFPDVATREQIWQQIFPNNTPIKNIDISKLANLDVTGGNIRNIALNAAFLAAENNESVSMPHLAKAARREFGKMEKSIKESELRSWL